MAGLHMSSPLFDRVLTPDPAAVMASPADTTSPQQQTPLATRIALWCARDLRAVEESWRRARGANFSDDTLPGLHLANHNLFGASALYGGDALIVLAGTLQAVCRSKSAMRRSPELVSLLIEACRLCSGDRGLSQRDLAEVKGLCALVRRHLLGEQ
jgi:hypothetical protein